MRKTLTGIRCIAVVLGLMVLASTASAQLNKFGAGVVVDTKVKITGAFGQFTPASSIDLSSQSVTLSVAGTNTFGWTFTAGSFKKLRTGGYLATATSGTTKVYVFLQPLKTGVWLYSTAIDGFVPGSNPVTVALTIGAQSGSATVNAYVF